MNVSKAAYILASMLLATSAARAGMLPNGFSVSPFGEITPLGTLPLHEAVDPSGRWIAVTNSGYAAQGVSIVDARTGHVTDTKTLDGTFYGLAFSPDGKTL
ncbi:MAG TPA: hypothetical protein VEJ20_07300, partial [Candidatus Eremiobacteraceae bacterium]|nr:hypothetical protein [Candidatus Eremiobacteraceae bacterium]